MRSKTILALLALICLGAGAAAHAAGPGAQTQASGALTVTYYYMPG